ncbi:MAG: serine/threonine protein kinase [Planctomycetales bacterium]|nr:serine/threonine protein kinase [Planctomycetales bacterium]
MAQDRNHIGSYRLLKLVRAGATCQIWEVLDEIENRRCALKSLQSDFRKDREQIALLKHEYTVGHTLDHPSVIDIYEYNVENGIPYVALEYFDSSNLKQAIREARDTSDTQLPFDQDRMTSIIRQCAEGLGYLHDSGWVHRDVKPDNFLVNAEGVVKLIDFAIAEKIKKGFGRFLAGKSKVQGTRSYMSPEQIRGETLDARSDIYSLGCVIFEMHAGRPPFTGGSPDHLLQKHLKAPAPPIAASCGDVSPDFNDLVISMMSKKRELRPESISDLLQKLDTIRMYKRAKA